MVRASRELRFQLMCMCVFFRAQTHRTCSCVCPSMSVSTAVTCMMYTHTCARKKKKFLCYLITPFAKMYSETSSEGERAKHKCIFASLFFITALSDATRTHCSQSRIKSYLTFIRVFTLSGNTNRDKQSACGL